MAISFVSLFVKVSKGASVGYDEWTWLKFTRKPDNGDAANLSAYLRPQYSANDVCWNYVNPFYSRFHRAYGWHAFHERISLGKSNDFHQERSSRNLEIGTLRENKDIELRWFLEISKKKKRKIGAIYSFRHLLYNSSKMWMCDFTIILTDYWNYYQLI